MHVALQSARNQASLETLLKAEELMTAHFNLAVLANKTVNTKTSDAQKPETISLDAEPSGSAADEQTYIKIPNRHYPANSKQQKQHPTGAVIPTCRRDYGQPTVQKVNTQSTGASCQSLPKNTTQVSNTIDLSTDGVLV